MGWTVGLEPTAVGHWGHIPNIPGLPGTRDGMHSGLGALCSGTLGTCPGCIPGLWNGMNSGIGALHSGTLGTCLGCP